MPLWLIRTLHDDNVTRFQAESSWIRYQASLYVELKVIARLGTPYSFRLRHVYISDPNKRYIELSMYRRHHPD